MHLVGNPPEPPVHLFPQASEASHATIQQYNVNASNPVVEQVPKSSSTSSLLQAQARGPDLNEKRFPKDAIKNSADQDPEGY